MRHLKRGRKFGRVKKGREALLRNLAFSFLKAGRITTTEAKAKELRPFVEKLITSAKSQSLAARRRLHASLPASIVPKLMQEIAPKYSGRSGGYTRIIKLGKRKSDTADMTILELV
ncbi:MAG: 50S ribosomal protein L17 [Candidatus Sungiibacteriota bacterium]